MSLKRYRRKAKELVRRNADTLVRFNRVGTAIGATAAAFIPVVGLVAAPVVAFAGASAGRYFSSANARYEGKSGHRARQIGRNEFVRTGLYGAAGAAVGIGATAVIGAGSFASTPAAGAGVNGLPAGFGGVTPGESAAAASAFGFASPSTVPAGFGGTTAAQAAAAASAFGYTSPISAGFPAVTQAVASSGSSFWGTVGTAAGAAVQAVPTISGFIKAPAPPTAPGTSPETGNYGYEGAGGSGGGGTLNADGTAAAGKGSGSGLAVAAIALLLLAG